MKYLELRSKIENSIKYPETEIISHSPIIHEGFRGNFNISFAEEPFLKKFGNYLDNSKNFYFSTIQPVIRVNDFKDNIDDTHLLLFDMADISGFIGDINTKTESRKEIAKFTITKTFEFLIKDLKLKPEYFLISYLSGGQVKKLTKNKYNFDKYIKSDPFIEIAKKYGIREKQFIPDSSRTTLLALNFTPPVAWGYRNEILYKTPTLNEPLDIASIENLLWRPVYKNETIVGLEEWKNFWSFQVVGVERLLMLLNNSDKIYEADHIMPLINKFSEICKNSDVKFCRLTMEILRVIHRISSDIKKFSLLSSSRKEKLIPYRRKFLENCKKADIDYKIFLKDLLILNGNLQPCYPELLFNLDQQVNEIISWLSRGKIK